MADYGIIGSNEGPIESSGNGFRNDVIRA